MLFVFRLRAYLDKKLNKFFATVEDERPGREREKTYEISERSYFRLHEIGHAVRDRYGDKCATYSTAIYGGEMAVTVIIPPEGVLV